MYEQNGAPIDGELQGPGQVNGAPIDGELQGPGQEVEGGMEQVLLADNINAIAHLLASVEHLKEVVGE